MAPQNAITSSTNLPMRTSIYIAHNAHINTSHIRSSPSWYARNSDMLDDPFPPTMQEKTCEVAFMNALLNSSKATEGMTSAPSHLLERVHHLLESSFVEHHSFCDLWYSSLIVRCHPSDRRSHPLSCCQIGLPSYSHRQR